MSNLLEENLSSTKGKQDPKDDEKEEVIIEIKDITESPKHNSNHSIIKQDVEHLNKDANTKDYIELRISTVNELMKNMEKAKDKNRNHKSNVFVPKNKKSTTVWVQYSTDPGAPGQDPNQYSQPTKPDGFGGGAEQGGGFDYDPNTRNSFVKLVFVILTIMLLLTGGLVISVFFIPVLTEFYMGCGKIYLLLSLGLVVGLNFLMACCGCTRMPPFNYLCLFLTVILMSNIVAFLSVRYKVHVLCLAFIATAITVFICMLIACSSFDFTKWYLYFVMISITFCAISLVISIAMFVMNIRFKPLQIAVLFVGSLINVVAIVMELQMILGGRSIELGESDYALGAYLLYTSIISLFIDLLQLIGILDN